MERVGERIVGRFTRRGYELVDILGDAVVLRKGEEQLRIRMMQEPLILARLPEAVEGRSELVVALAGADLRALAEAEARGIEVWDRDRFRSEIGEGLIEDALDSSPPLAALEEATQAGGEGVEEGIAEPAVTKEQALEMAARVAPFRCEMVHIPWYLMQVEVGGSVKRRVALAVNAITGKVSPWRKWVGVRKDAPWAHVAREPVIDLGQARELALSALRGMLASSETREKKGSIVVVRKDFDAVTGENATVTDTGLFQMPHWCAEGVRGMVVINAATGAVVEESYFEGA
jgi:hypothetical protein